MIEKAKNAIRNEFSGKEIAPLILQILKDTEKVKNFMVLYNKEEKIQKLDRYRVSLSQNNSQQNLLSNK